ncbi:MAG TPA: UDP-N-acetylglucosamine 2-epimerase (non-hydrolyzing) [Candidatus Polarisedimenticolaceae bacterium]|nr:UDP-N-acetylglucosamine 2-epimerase (non-hydrolyzing) [Candidatus Polarisedimenticolaceae bacterium]
MRQAHIVHVAGARPNFMKIASVLAACGARPELRSTLVHTGQHYDGALSKLFFDELRIPRPDVNLEVGSGSHAAQTAAILERFEPVLLEKRPDLVLVVGDVNSTIACALAAVKLEIPVAHVEAGLRSFDRTMPEEINRVLTDAISEFLFVSEESGLLNLRREGVADERVHFVGNVMIDTLLAHREAALRSDVLARLGLDRERFAVLTLHRPANVDAPDALRRILDPVAALAETMPVILPVHPRARAGVTALSDLLGRGHGIRLLDPLGYLDFVALMSAARLILTDSGGIQEEATILGVPCLTLRDNTERPVTITHGTNRLAGTSSAGIRAAIAAALEAPRTVPPAPRFWDGRAGERIAEVLAAWARAR